MWRSILTVIFLLLTLPILVQGQDTTVSITQPFSPLSYCPGDTAYLDYTVSRKFRLDNRFTAELSDAWGGFGNPVPIGYFLSDTSGMITCIIPDSMSAGSAYRIRITASSPVRMSANNGANITIRPRPVLTPTSNSPVCENNTLLLNAGNSTSPYITWDGPGAYFATGNAVNRTGMNTVAAGNYTVTAITNGCSTTKTIQVSVKALPVPILTTNSPACLGDTMKFLFSGTPSSIYKLTLPDGSEYNAVQYLIVHQAVMKYAGTCTLSATLDGCTDSVLKNFSVVPLPDTPDIISNSPLCKGANLQFYALLGTSTSASYVWTGPNGFSSTASTPYVLSVGSVHEGVYMLRSKLNGCYSVPTYDTVEILDSPPKPIGESNSPLCEGDSMKLTVQKVPNGTYLWTGPNNFKSNMQNPALPSITVLANGYYIVQDSINGCTNRDTIFVEVNAYPKKPHVETNAPICPVDTLMLKALTDIDGADFKWVSSQNNHYAGQTVIIYPVKYTDTSWYTVLANNKGCATQGDTNFVSIKPMPAIPSIIHNAPLWEGQELQLKAQTNEQGIKTYWTGPENWSDTAWYVTRANMSKAYEGSYILTIDKDGCKASALTNISIKDFTSKYEFTLYPSPNNGDFTISGKLDADQTVRIRILSANGQEVFNIGLDSDKRFINHRFYLRDRLSSGIYTLQATYNRRIIQIPFTVIR